MVARQVDLPREYVTRVGKTTARLTVTLLPSCVVATVARRRAGLAPVPAWPSTERLADIAVAVVLSAPKVAPVVLPLAMAGTTTGSSIPFDLE